MLLPWLAYKGSAGYLKPEERAAIIDWLQKNNYWNLGELKAYIEERYEIVVVLHSKEN